MHQCVNVNEAFMEHLKSVTNGASDRSIAMAIGMVPSTLARQLSGELKVQTVVAICRHFGAPFLPAFVAAGFITPDEASAMRSVPSLPDVSAEDLMREVLRRVQAGGTDAAKLEEPFGPEHPQMRELNDVGGTDEDPSKMTDDEARTRYRLAADHSDAEQDLDERTP
jgi:hypothetical protein